MSDVFAPQPVKTKAAGDVVVNINSGQTVGLAAGSAKVGVVTTDQTTHGTTDLVASDQVKVNGVAIATGNGVSGTGVQRVNIASDNTAFPVNATVTQGTGTNLHAVLDTGSTTAVTQATGSNLHAVLDTGSTTAVTQATGTNLHTVVDSGALTVSQATGSNLHVVVDSGTISTSGGGLVGTVVDNYNTSAALAAGATITLDSTSVPSGTGHLTEATVSSSVSIKAQLGTWNGTVFTVKRTFFVAANTPFAYFPSRSDELSLATGATATYRWSITNNDNANAADVYCSTTYYYA
jgi:hypothetical protein